MRYDDPILETIARSIHTFFPRCVKCGEPIESFEEADIRILTNRVVHRGNCLRSEIGAAKSDALNA
jgi:hypothetical protein